MYFYVKNCKQNTDKVKKIQKKYKKIEIVYLFTIEIDQKRLYNMGKDGLSCNKNEKIFHGGMEMKNKKALLVSALLAACTLTTTAGISAMAETVSVGYPKSINIARGLDTSAFTLTDYEGNAVQYVVAGPNVGSDRTYTMANVHNGDISSWDVVAPSKDGQNKTLAWLNVDLGGNYTVDKITFTMNHDWEGTDVVIQVATNADFSDAITIYNNDIDNSLGCGATFTADKDIEVKQYLQNYGDLGTNDQGNGNTFEFTPVEVRYVRATNHQYGNAAYQNFTALGELGVFGYENVTPTASAQVAPVAFSKVAGTYGKALSVELGSTQADAEIYYTLDGSVPTKNSTKYTEAIEVAMNTTKFIRAAACVNGIMGVPVTAEYVVRDPLIGTNIAFNKPVTIKSLDMSQDWTEQLTSVNKAGEEGANAASRITDGSFDIWYALYTGNLGRGWAIIDLQAEYYIEYIVYEAYWDWWMGNNVIQMANNADFSDAVTVWEYSGGIQTGTASSQNGYKVDINHKGRYIRVTNDKEGGGTISAWTEMQAFVGVEPPAGSLVGKNIAFEKPVTMKSLDMKEDWTDFVHDTNQGSTIDTAEQFITDGQFDFWHAINTYQKGKAWFVIDLGANYWMNRILYDAYWDWWVAEHEIQIAKSADFSDAVTVYSYAEGLQTKLGTEIKFNAIEGRYIRVTNLISNHIGTMTVVTELQAFACEAPAGDPITEKAYLASYERPENVTVANGTAWTDINLPTEITATMSDGTTATVAGTFAMPEGYNGNAGAYTAKFVATDASALNDAYELLAKVEVVITVEKSNPTISVEVAERIVADGNAPVVTVNASMDYVVEYYQGETKLDAAPTAAGEYKVVAIIAESANNNAATAEKSFVIVDYRALAAKLAEVAALEQATYTSASWTAFAEAKAAAETVAANEVAAQADIDGALSNLTSAVEALVVKADFSALQAAVAAAEEVVLDSYISAGKADFSAALAAAKAALENDATAQADVDAAKAALEAAQAALVQKGDKAELNSLLAEVAELVEGEYTAETWTAFAEAKAAAEAVVANEDAVQADIDAAKAALEAAKGALAQKPADEPVDEPSEEKPSDEQPSEEKPSDEKPAGGLGCGATISIASIVMIAGLGVANLLRKKEED